MKKLKDMMLFLEKESNGAKIEHVAAFINKCQAFYHRASNKLHDLKSQSLLNAEEKTKALCSFFAEDYTTFKVRLSLFINQLYYNLVHSINAIDK